MPMPFCMDDLRLTTPTVVQNGNSHFTRILVDDSPLYFQTPRCDTKQGIVTTTAKKTYYDLILDSNSETSHTTKEFTAFVEWIQTLEDAIIKLLHTNGKLWFRDPLSEDDIRALFTSPLKPLKGGSQLSLRINVPTSVTRALQYACTVFDENEKLVHLNYITPEHQLISIIEVLGVRFTSSSFHLDLASKQIAVVTNQPLFQTCVIKKDIDQFPIQTPAPILTPTSGLKKNESLLVPVDSISNSQPTEELKSITDADIKITLTEKDDIVHIHDPLQVYYSLYKAALKRAKEAKRQSIQAFLDAKNIKNTYNLDVYDDEISDDNDDTEHNDSGRIDDRNNKSEIFSNSNDDNHSENHSENDIENDSKNDSKNDNDNHNDAEKNKNFGSESEYESDASETLGKPPIRIIGNQNVTIKVEEIFS